MMSVIVSTIGPSSRMLPARTKSTPARTHSTMMPLFSTPVSTAALMPPARLIALIARMWWRWPPWTGVPGLEIDAERRAEERLLRVVHGEGIAREHHVDEAATDELVEVRAAAGVDDDRARRRRRCASPRALVSRIIVAMRATLASTRRSDETSFDMNAKSPRSRSRNSGVTRNAVQPADDPVARLDLAQLAAHGAVARRPR